MADSTVAEPAIAARALTLHGPHGRVYGPLDLDIDRSGVTVLIGPPGLAGTALLLTLAGRMRPTSGELTVCGQTRTTDIFAAAAVAGIDGVDEIAGDVTVGDVLTEQLRWNSPWYRRIRQADETDLTRVCGPVFGDLPLPALDRYIDELPELDGLLLRVALANTARPPLLVVGTLEQVTDNEQRDLLVERLVDLGSAQTVVAASVNGVPGQPVQHCQLGAKAGV
ncbi:hypothetical protein ACAG25_19120 [Mycobacterium sp. pV006]|uniref:hypothetical protein n=1 Tax=Mycobacterium sp. pV006 TaxID=3238983 RepID=UPI00351ABF29